MVYLATGKNRYYIDEQIRDIMVKLKQQSPDLAVDKISSYDSLIDLKLNLLNYSIFSSQRLVILDSPSRLKGFGEMLQDIYKDFSEDLTLILIEQEIDKRSLYYKFAIKNATLISRDNMTGGQLLSWITDYVKDNSGQIDFSAATHLINRVGNNQLNLKNELDKLLLYNSKITKESIDLLTEASIASNIFNLLDAGFNANLKLAIKIYQEQRSQDNDPAIIISMIVWQLKNLALIKSSNMNEAAFLRETHMNINTYRNSLKIARKISIKKLRELVSYIYRTDLYSKQYRSNLDEYLKNFLVLLAI